MCIVEENIENFGLGTIMMSGGLDYSCMRNQNHQCVTVAVACGQRSTWHSVVMKPNEVALCHAVESEFGIGLHLCIFTRNIQNILV